MADKWELFKQWWGTDDEDSPITDASQANDYMVENAISDFQGAAKGITDMTVALSAARVEVDESLRKLREAVTLSYTYALDSRLEDVRKTLEKVLDV